jgi:hypothetical protein
MIRVDDTVKRVVATSTSLLPKGTVGEVAAVTNTNLILVAYRHLLLPLEDFVKVNKEN